jgi:hypothetical protein
MFSKKNLHISLAFVLLIALASLGLAYGAWQETLTINGTVSTGNFDVIIEGAYADDYGAPYADCNLQVVNDNQVTLTITNGYPGYLCEGGAIIRNKSSVPVKINGIVKSGTGSSSYFNVNLTDQNQVTIPAGGSFVLPVEPNPVPPSGVKAGGLWWSFFMPATETGGEGETLTYTYTILAEQATQ